MTAQPNIARWCAAALLVTPDGRYLMQHRDDKPTIFLPGHWACFGGTIDAAENPETAIRRELQEEIEFAAGKVTLFTEMIIDLPFANSRRDRMSFFAVPITHDEIDRLVQHEGQGMGLFLPQDLAREAKVAPWDLAAILMHARQHSLFGR